MVEGGREAPCLQGVTYPLTLGLRVAIDDRATTAFWGRTQCLCNHVGRRARRQLWPNLVVQVGAVEATLDDDEGRAIDNQMLKQLGAHGWWECG